jgi:hypothetical protein
VKLSGVVGNFLRVWGVEDTVDGVRVEGEVADRRTLRSNIDFARRNRSSSSSLPEVVGTKLSPCLPEVCDLPSRS